MLAMLKRFVTDEEGLETVEYALISGLIVVGTILILSSIGTKVLAKFTALDTGL